MGHKISRFCYDNDGEPKFHPMCVADAESQKILDSVRDTFPRSLKRKVARSAFDGSLKFRPCEGKYRHPVADIGPSATLFHWILSEKAYACLHGLLSTCDFYRLRVEDGEDKTVLYACICWERSSEIHADQYPMSVEDEFPYRLFVRDDVLAVIQKHGLTGLEI